jgi:hypothetical protein
VLKEQIKQIIKMNYRRYCAMVIQSILAFTFISILPDIFDGFVLLFFPSHFQLGKSELSLGHIFRSVVIIGLVGGFVFGICFVAFFIFLDIKAMEKGK